MQNKKQVIQEFLSQGKSVVCINSKVDGVKLPKHLMDQIQVKLALSLKFPNPIHFNDNGIETKLKFAGRQQKVYLPYTSIYAVSDPQDLENSVLWEEDTPADLFDIAEDVLQQLETLVEKQISKAKEKSKYLDFEAEVKKLKKS